MNCFLTSLFTLALFISYSSFADPIRISDPKSLDRNGLAFNSAEKLTNAGEAAKEKIAAGEKEQQRLQGEADSLQKQADQKAKEEKDPDAKQSSGPSAEELKKQAEAAAKRAKEKKEEVEAQKGQLLAFAKTSTAGQKAGAAASDAAAGNGAAGSGAAAANGKPVPAGVPPEVAAKIPAGWESRPTKTPGGTEFYNPSNPKETIRYMPGQPNSPYPEQQGAYVKMTDANGNTILPSGERSPSFTQLPDESNPRAPQNPKTYPAGNPRHPEAHIPADDFNGYPSEPTAAKPTTANPEIVSASEMQNATRPVAAEPTASSPRVTSAEPSVSGGARTGATAGAESSVGSTIAQQARNLVTVPNIAGTGAGIVAGGAAAYGTDKIVAAAGGTDSQRQGYSKVSSIVAGGGVGGAVGAALAGTAMAPAVAGGIAIAGAGEVVIGTAQLGYYNVTGIHTSIQNNGGYTGGGIISGVKSYASDFWKNYKPVGYWLGW